MLMRSSSVGIGAELLDENLLAQKVTKVATYIRNHFNRDEVHLLEDSTQVLTAVFIQGLQQLARRHLVALFFDAYELTGKYLDPWLRDVLDERYGDFPENVIVTSAGRSRLNFNAWCDKLPLIESYSLEPFTDAEARDYLSRKGITEEQTVSKILRLTGKLPIFVVTLAAVHPKKPEDVNDPTDDAIQLFLQWVDDISQRQVAIDAALLRSFNQDRLAWFVSPDEVRPLFDWLIQMPFISKDTDGWTYHAVVRSQMLRHKQTRTVQGWATLHQQLADHYDALRQDAALQQKDATWQRYTLEALYHRLCQSPQTYLTTALNGFLAALKSQRAFALRWATTMQQAGVDANAAAIATWGQRLVSGLTAYEEDCYADVVEMFDALVQLPALDPQHQATALGHRGETYRLMGRYEDALADVDQVLTLKPEDAWNLANRGETYRLMERYEDALADLDRAIAIDPEDAWNLARRGVTYGQMGRYEDALANFDHVLTLKPEDAFALAHRGTTYRQMERYEDALADFDRAIALNPENEFALTIRGDTYRLMGRYEEALADFDRAIALNPEYDWIFYSRALTHQLTNQPALAQADFTAAIQKAQTTYDANSQNWQNTFNLALYYLADKQSEVATRLCTEVLPYASASQLRAVLQDLNELIRVYPSHSQALTIRNQVMAKLSLPLEVNSD